MVAFGLSWVTPQELIALKTTLYVSYNKRFSCDYCLNEKYHGRPNLLKKERYTLGCERIAEEPIHSVEGFLYHTCIGNGFSRPAYHWIRSYDAFTHGILPYPGGYFDQPSKAIEILEIIGAYHQEREIEKLKEIKRQNDGRRNNTGPVSRRG